MAERSAHALLRVAAAQRHLRLNEKRCLLYDVRARAGSRPKQLLFGLYSTRPRRCPRSPVQRRAAPVALSPLSKLGGGQNCGQDPSPVLSRYLELPAGAQDLDQSQEGSMARNQEFCEDSARGRVLAVVDSTALRAAAWTRLQTRLGGLPARFLSFFSFLKGAHELVQPLVEGEGRLVHGFAFPPRTGRRCDRTNGPFLLFEVVSRVCVQGAFV